MRRRFRPSWLLASAALLLAPAPAAAQFGIPQVVVDPKAIAEAVRNGRRAAEQIVLQKRQIEYQIQMLRSLKDPNWRHIGLLHEDLAEVVREGEALGYSMQRLETEFDRAFPGYHASRDPRAADIDRMRRVLATQRAQLRAAGIQAGDAAQGQRTLDRIKAQVSGAEGTQEALQASATIQGYTADRLDLIAQQLAAQANADAVWRSHELQRRMEAAAALDSLVAATRARPVVPLGSRDVRWRQR